MFDADRPILNSASDRLNRSQFAKYLARCLLDHENAESLVVGLYGSWGVGKTSIINLIIEELHSAANYMLDQEKPIILNFSAWSYSGQNQLIYSFFRRLSSTLHQVENLENKERIIHLLELYVSFFTHEPIPKPFRTKRSFWEKITFQKKEEVFAWESGRDLTLVKMELNELLRKQHRKIIIMIDNISRLYEKEIKQIFQIVKSMGDYVNTTYLLALDKEQIIEALDKVSQGNGREYLEKIVQLPFEIPPILQKDLENILADRLCDVFAQVPENTWNKEYWADIYYGSLKYFFKNCRDITRYVNTLHFSYPRLKEVVNPVDFFALTALEVFLPSLYFGIRDNKDLFSDLLDNVYLLDKNLIRRDKKRCEEILSRTNIIPHDILLNLLLNLFPRLRNIYYPESVFYHSFALARNLKRLCSPDLFDVYFRLSMKQSEIPDSEFENILELSTNKEGFDHVLTRLNQDDRILQFLDQLDSQVLNHIPKEQIAAIINGLLDNGDLFPVGIKGPLNLETPMRIHRIINRLLKRFDHTDERFSIMQHAIANATKSIFIIVSELKMAAREHDEESNTFLPAEFRLFLPQQLTSLRELTVNRIEAWANSGRLQEHPKLLPLLEAWHEWGDVFTCQAYVKQLTQTDRGLIAFLMAVFEQPINEAMQSYVKLQEWENKLAEIELFISIASIKPHAIQLFEDNYFEKLREREQLAIMIFLDVSKANTKKVIPKTSV